MNSFVKIINCSSEYYWYTNMIGTICEVKQHYAYIDRWTVINFFRVKSENMEKSEKFINKEKNSDLTIDKKDCQFYNFRPEKIKKIL